MWPSFPSGSYGAGDRKAAVECRKATRPPLTGAPVEAFGPRRDIEWWRLLALHPLAFRGGKTPKARRRTARGNDHPRSIT